MLPPQTAELLRIHISEAGRIEGKPLYEAIVAACRELQIAGATVFRGLEGFGDDAEIVKPILITVADTPVNIQRLIPVVAAMIDTGVMATSSVQMIRVQRNKQ